MVCVHMCGLWGAVCMVYEWPVGSKGRRCGPDASHAHPAGRKPSNQELLVPFLSSLGFFFLRKPPSPSSPRVLQTKAEEAGGHIQRGPRGLWCFTSFFWDPQLGARLGHTQ